MDISLVLDQKDIILESLKVYYLYIGKWYIYKDLSSWFNIFNDKLR